MRGKRTGQPFDDCEWVAYVAVPLAIACTVLAWVVER